MALLAACSVEGKRQLGDSCLTNRECAAGLVCEFNALGNASCARAVTFDAAFDAPGATDTPAPPPDAVTPDTTGPADVAAMQDAADTTAPPPDVRPDVPADVPADVAVDVRPDVAPDVPDMTDAGARDAADAMDPDDARGDVSTDGG